jgi:hypothetical protein
MAPLQPTLCLAEDTCHTSRQQYFENTDAKVWSTTICPEQHLKFHTHLHARVLIPGSDGALKVLYKNKPSVFVHLKKGVPAYLDKEEGIYPHQDINVGIKPLSVTVIELKKS